MPIDVKSEVAALERLTAGQLAKRYEEIFGETCRSRHKKYLVRRIIWRLQANAEGGLSERARKRAEELADDAEIRVTPPREPKPQCESPRADILPMAPTTDPRLPPVGNWIERTYKGHEVRVLVVADGFEYEGKRYRSLSAIAKKITGSHVNGYLFFKLWRDK